MKGSSPPVTPDYVGMAQAQGAENLEAARTNARLNNPNVQSPYGTQTVTYGGFDQSGYDRALADYNAFQPTYDPVTGRQTNQPPTQPTREQFAISNDIPTVTQQFSPEQQAIYDQQTGNQQGLGLLAGQGIGAAQGIIGSAVDYSGAPPPPGSYDSLRSEVYDAMMARPMEDLGIKRDTTNSNLIAAGIRPGSKAYDDAMHMINRQEVDAQQQALINAGNQTQQAYGMDLQSRQQGLAEQLAQRQIPLNEITALMSGSQASNPFQMPTFSGNANVQPAPVYNAGVQGAQYGTDVYNAQQANTANQNAGLYGLGGTALMAGAMMF